MKITVKLLLSLLIIIAASQAASISYDLRANIFQAKVYSATDTNWTNIDVYYVANTNGWEEPNQGWGSFDRRRTSSGGVKKNSIFAHPDYEGQLSATVAEFTLTYPSSISTYYGLSDNQQYNYGDVRFVIQIKEENNYITILDSIVADGDFWRYFQYDLSQWSNDSVLLRLITDPNGWAAEDWAHWSETVVVTDHTPTKVYVSQSGSDPIGDGSQGNPYATIQWGIEMAVESDTVLVLPGTYVENINYNGNNVALGSLFLTTYDTSYISQTIIDGDSVGTVVTFNNGEDMTALLSGFTITNGYSTWGGGITVSYSSPTLSNLMITGNTAEEGGGAINCWKSDDVVISDCLITKNFSAKNAGGVNLGRSDLTIVNSTITYNGALGGSGGGISMWQSAPIIDNISISENSAEGSGGGVAFWSSSPTLTNCLIIGNTSENEGGGITSGGDSLLIINSVIHGNSASSGAGIQAYQSYIEIHNSYFTNNFQEGGHGAGIYLKDSTTAIVSNTVISGNSAYNGGGVHFYNNFSSSLFYNCTIVDNLTDVGGGGITVGQNSSPVFVNSIFWNDQETDVFIYNGGTVTIAYSDIQDGWEGEGNINSDPLFVDPANGYFHLQEDSPCIDAGTSLFIWNSDTLVNLPASSYNGYAPDMGAFEYASVSLKDYSNITPDEFSLSQNYPNPFNPKTTLNFDLPKAVYVRIILYDILGREIIRLVDGNLEVGYHLVTWNGKMSDGQEAPTGIYIARMETPEFSRSIKMLLMK